MITQISAPTQTAAQQSDASASHSCQSLTIVGLEAFVTTVGSMRPNPGRRNSAERPADPGDEVRVLERCASDGVRPRLIASDGF